MIKELVIHLGDCKTGSTSIQSVLANKSWHCSSARLIYPSRSNHNSLANAIRGTGNGLSLLQRGERLRERLLRRDAEFGVLSAEHFEFVSPHDLANFLDKYLPETVSHLRLIAYIRPHADNLLSRFGERSKIGLRCASPAQLHRKFLANGLLMYAPRLREWRNVFGTKVTFKPFIRRMLYEQDVVLDFFRFVFGDHAFTLRDSQLRNESLCLEDLVMLRKVHSILRQRFGFDLSTVQSFGRRMGNVLASSGATGTRPCLHLGLVEDIISAYRDDAIAVDQEFFTGNPMLSALEGHRDKVVEEEQSLNIEDYYSQEAIRHMTCWAEFVGQIIASNQKQFKSIPLEWHSRSGKKQSLPSAKRKVRKGLKQTTPTTS